MRPIEIEFSSSPPFFERRSMQIAWYGPGQPSPRQLAGLREIYGDDVAVDFCGQVRNAAVTVTAFRRSGADEAVVVAPLAVCDHLLREGLQPLWADAEVVDASHPEREWEVRGRHFRHLGFKRLVALDLKTEVPKALEVVTRPVRVAWFTRHHCEVGQMSALQALYGPDVEIVHARYGERGSADVAYALKSIQATDFVLVAPLSIFDALCKQGIHPLQGVMDGNRFVEFRRVTGLELRFEAVER